MSKSDDQCVLPRCRRTVAVIYLGKNVCDRHWSRYADDRAALRRAVGLRGTPDYRPTFVNSSQAPTTSEVGGQRGDLENPTERSFPMARKSKKSAPSADEKRLPLNQWLCEMFKRNAREKLTDDEIVKQVGKEYGDFRRKYERVHLVTDRRKYNQGVLARGWDAPAKPSVPYDADGNPLAVRRGPQGPRKAKADDAPAPKRKARAAKKATAKKKAPARKKTATKKKTFKKSA